MVEQVIDLESIDKGEYFIQASFDDQLQDLKEKLDDVEEDIRKQQKKAERDLELDNIKLEIVSHIGYHFRVTTRNDTFIRKDKNYKIIDAVNSGIRFTSTKLSDLNNKFQETKLEYEELQKAIVAEVVKTAG